MSDARKLTDLRSKLKEFTTQNLISAVKVQPGLWNPTSDAYKNKEAKIKSWGTVAEELVDNYWTYDENTRCTIGKIKYLI